MILPGFSVLLSAPGFSLGRQLAENPFSNRSADHTGIFRRFPQPCDFHGRPDTLAVCFPLLGICVHRCASLFFSLRSCPMTLRKPTFYFNWPRDRDPAQLIGTTTTQQQRPSRHAHQ